MKVLPENILKCMTPQDRKALGQKTATEVLERGERVSERQLQGQIVNLLRLRGIEVLWHRTDKKSAATVGWPDLTFMIRHQYRCDDQTTYNFVEYHACLWEVKLPGRKLSPEQEALRPKLEANGWRWRLITSVDEALAELNNLGITSE